MDVVTIITASFALIGGFFLLIERGTRIVYVYRRNRQRLFYAQEDEEPEDEEPEIVIQIFTRRNHILNLRTP